MLLILAGLLIGFLALVIVSPIASEFLTSRANMLVNSFEAWRSEVRRGLTYKVGGEYTDPSSWLGWDVFGPIVYFILFLILATGELYLSSLRFSALFGVSSEGLALGAGVLELLSGVLLATVVAAWGLVVFDLYKLSPMRRPFFITSLIKKISIVGLSLSVFSSGLFFLWGQGQIEGSTIPWLSFIFIFLFGILLSGSVVITGWSLLVAPIAIMYLLTAPIKGLFVLYRGVLRLINAHHGALITHEEEEPATPIQPKEEPKTPRTPLIKKKGESRKVKKIERKQLKDSKKLRVHS